MRGKVKVYSPHNMQRQDPLLKPEDVFGSSVGAAVSQCLVTDQGRPQIQVLFKYSFYIQGGPKKSL